MLGRREVISYCKPIPLLIGKVVRKRVYYIGSSKIKQMWSEELFNLVRAPAMSCGPYVIKRLGTKGIVFTLTVMRCRDIRREPQSRIYKLN